jgi:hypothetical protein
LGCDKYSSGLPQLTGNSATGAFKRAREVFFQQFKTAFRDAAFGL